MDANLAADDVTFTPWLRMVVGKTSQEYDQSSEVTEVVKNLPSIDSVIIAQTISVIQV